VGFAVKVKFDDGDWYKGLVSKVLMVKDRYEQKKEEGGEKVEAKRWEVTIMYEDGNLETTAYPDPFVVLMGKAEHEPAPETEAPAAVTSSSAAATTTTTTSSSSTSLAVALPKTKAVKKMGNSTAAPPPPPKHVVPLPSPPPPLPPTNEGSNKVRGRSAGQRPRAAQNDVASCAVTREKNRAASAVPTVPDSPSSDAISVLRYAPRGTPPPLLLLG
jgi:hypothetical protein